MKLPAINATFIPEMEVDITPLRVTVDGQRVEGWRRAVIVAAATPVFVIAVLAVVIVMATAAPALLLAKWLTLGMRTDKP